MRLFGPSQSYLDLFRPTPVSEERILKESSLRRKGTGFSYRLCHAENSLFPKHVSLKTRPIMQHYVWETHPGNVEKRFGFLNFFKFPFVFLFHGATHQGHSDLNQATKSSGAVRARVTSEKTKKKRKKGIRKKRKGLAGAGPWLVKLSLADNGIDGKGREGERGLLEFIRTLSCLIQYSAHLQEVDLGSNILGEKAAAGILEALRARKTGKLPVLKIIVTPQISSETFRSIWKNSQKSRINRKKKKKAKI